MNQNIKNLRHSWTDKWTLTQHFHHNPLIPSSFPNNPRFATGGKDAKREKEKNLRKYLAASDDFEVLGQDINELPLALVTPLATQNAGDLAQRADAGGGGVGGGELGGRRRDGLGRAYDNVSRGTAAAEWKGTVRIAYRVRIKRVGWDAVHCEHKRKIIDREQCERDRVKNKRKRAQKGCVVDTVAFW